MSREYRTVSIQRPSVPGASETRRRPTGRTADARLGWLRSRSGLLLAAVLLSSCSEVRTLLGVSPAPASPTPSSSSGSLARMEAVACLDWSNSYPPALRARALDGLAEQLEGLVRPGSGGARLYVRAISSNSYQDRAALMGIDLPAVPPEPDPPDLQSQPLETRSLTAEYLAMRREAQAALRRAEAEARRQARALRRLRYPVSHTTDVMGCIQRASELLRGAGGERRLVLFSDLVRVGDQQLASRHRLDGMEVVVAFFPCTEAVRCERLRAEWREFFEQTGAEAVRFVTSDEPVDLFGLDGPSGGA